MNEETIKKRLNELLNMTSHRIILGEATLLEKYFVEKNLFQDTMRLNIIVMYFAASITSGKFTAKQIQEAFNDLPDYLNFLKKYSDKHKENCKECQKKESSADDEEEKILEETVENAKEITELLIRLVDLS